jgi:hypothetical protein
VPTAKGQVTASQPAAPSLDDLVACVREAHAGVVSGFLKATEHATNAGNALITAKELTPHGGWSNFLKRCAIGERQAERYMHLARLVGSNPSCGTDLAELSIQAAIKQLSPSRPRKAASGGRPATKTAIAHTSAADIIAAWDRAQNERSKAINSIGIEAWLAVLPRDWMPEIEKRLAVRRQPSAPTTDIDPTCAAPADLSIPACLRRDPAPDDASTSIPASFARGKARSAPNRR